MWPQNASLSSDAQYVAYDAPQREGAAARDVYVLRTDGTGGSTALVSHDSNDLFPIWTTDGVVFFSDRTGGLGMWLQPLNGVSPAGPPRVIDKDMGRMVPIGLTDQGALFYLKLTGMVDVFTIDMADLGNASAAAVVSPGAMGNNISSTFSADGKYLAYVAMRGLVNNDRYSRALVIKDLATGVQRDVMPALSGFIGPQWSPDGRSILVQGTDFQQLTGWHVIDLQSGRTRPVLTGPGIGNAIWSRDGASILYGRGNAAIVSRTLATGQDAVVLDVSKEGTIGGGPNQTFGLSPDGRTLAYRLLRQDAAAVRRTLRTMVIGGATRDLLTVTAPEVFEFQDWTPDGQDLLITRFASNGPRERSLWRISIHGGDPQPLGLSMRGLRHLHMHPGGRLLTFTSGANTHDIWTASNLHPQR